MTVGAFVGRDDELASARQWLRGALSGQGGVLVVSGDAGIGKSSFVRELTNDLPGGVVIGRAAPDSTVPARALTQAALAALAGGADPEDVSLRLRGRGVRQILGPVSRSPATRPGATSSSRTR